MSHPSGHVVPNRTPVARKIVSEHPEWTPSQVQDEMRRMGHNPVHESLIYKMRRELNGVSRRAAPAPRPTAALTVEQLQQLRAGLARIAPDLDAAEDRIVQVAALAEEYGGFGGLVQAIEKYKSYRTVLAAAA